LEYIEVLDLDDLKNDNHKVVKVNDKEIILYKTGDKITTIGNKCLHKGGPLSEGKVEKKYDGIYITCPWHG